ncbi:MAG: TetR/AcrR family transcriptional regulator [Pseudomonadota bacterium]
MADRLEQRAKVAEALVEHVLATGLSQVSVRQLAAAAGISDRMLIYYFGNKATAVSEVLMAAAMRMEAMLSAALPPGVRLPRQAMFDTMTAALRSEETRLFMALWIEIIAKSFREPDPYGPVATRIARFFLQWMIDRIEGETDDERKSNAALVFAMIDGMAMIEACLPDEETVPMREAVARAVTTAP